MKRKYEQQRFYHIIPNDLIVTFTEVGKQRMYKNEDGGFIRKAIAKSKKINRQHFDHYKDPQFKIPQSNEYLLVRLYNLYKKDIPIFPEDQQRSSYIQTQTQYSSFIAESGIISFDYLRTLFITQNINKQGYYQYFIKRNGQYYLQSCDDDIPVLKSTWKPLWNLTTDHPWQILLFKAWLKQCGSFENLFKAEPFSLLDAFGLPAYQLLNFRKQLHFIKSQKQSQKKKKQKQSNLSVNKIDVLIIAKSINDVRVEKVGLLPNLAGYRILKLSKQDQEPYFRVFSNLPCNWVGQYSPILNASLNKVHNSQMFLDLQRNFLLSQKEVLKYFNKFYVAPYQISWSDRIITQDCLSVVVENKKPIWINFSVTSQQGLVSLSILLPKVKNNSNKYPQFRYFLSKKKNQVEIAASHINVHIESKKEVFIESNCDKWECYGIDYIHGYHNTATLYCKVVEGYYMLYIDTDGYSGPINVRFDTLVNISKPQIISPSIKLIKQIFDSTFFGISQELGIEASLHGQTFQQSISINNSFQELGFGIISVKTLINAKNQIAMKIFPQKLRQEGYSLLQYYELEQNDRNEQKKYLYISQKGKPEIVVIERIDKKYSNSLGRPFPPQGTVEFFRVQPR